MPLSTVGPAWLLASLAAAALAHALIGAVGPWLAADAGAYDEHSHAAVVPVMLIALALAAAALLRIGAGIAARRRGADPVRLVAGEVAGLPALWAPAAIAAGAFAVLVVMEFANIRLLQSGARRRRTRQQSAVGGALGAARGPRSWRSRPRRQSVRRHCERGCRAHH